MAGWDYTILPSNEKACTEEQVEPLDDNGLDLLLGLNQASSVYMLAIETATSYHKLNDQYANNKVSFGHYVSGLQSLLQNLSDGLFNTIEQEGEI